MIRSQGLGRLLPFCAHPEIQKSFLLLKRLINVNSASASWPSNLGLGSRMRSDKILSTPELRLRRCEAWTPVRFLQADQAGSVPWPLVRRPVLETLLKNYAHHPTVGVGKRTLIEGLVKEWKKPLHVVAFVNHSPSEASQFTTKTLEAGHGVENGTSKNTANPTAKEGGHLLEVTPRGIPDEAGDITMGVVQRMLRAFLVHSMDSSAPIIEMLDYRRKRLEEEPVPLAEIIDVAKTGSKPSGETADGLEYRKVICEGVYDGSKSLHVGPRAKSDFGVTKKGYYLFTPLMGRGDNSAQVPVLVNRGWVPSGYKDELPDRKATFENIPTLDIESSKAETGSWWNHWSKRSKSNKQDEVVASPKYQATMKVCGVIRGSEQPNMFVPPNAPESGQWFYVDVPAMARAAGLPEDTILIEAVQGKENIKATDKYPVPKDPEALLHASVMPRDHINYALTWYTLSAATTYMAVKRVRNARRGF